ncbi:hypothetical protein CSE16_05105 [Solibacillus sp. R5-41]|nr:hypothetical protein CSE16_05105 [Solibacillus sp. R5-41]
MITPQVQVAQILKSFFFIQQKTPTSIGVEMNASITFFSGLPIVQAQFKILTQLRRGVIDDRQKRVLLEGGNKWTNSQSQSSTYSM